VNENVEKGWDGSKDSSECWPDKSGNYGKALAIFEWMRNK